MTELQEQTIKAIVNVFETGRVAGDYGAVTVLKGDAGHLTYGRSQTTLGSGNLFLLIKAYCERPDTRFSSDLRPFLPDLAARNVELDLNVTLRDLLKEAGDDPAMRSEQNRFFDDNYFKPACRTAATTGVVLPLGQAVIYDSFIQGGFRKVSPLVAATVGAGIDEKHWVQKYVAARKVWLSGLPDPLPKTIYRTESFSTLMDADAWDLPLPLKVHNVMITEESLKDPQPVVRASSVDPVDPPAPRILQLTSPYMRGEDVRQLQESLNTLGFGNGRDSLFGPFTEALVKKFQQSRQLRADGVVGPTTRAALGL
jgi:chitosanase